MSEKRPSRVRPVKSTIVIVDDHPIVRRGLAALIDNEPDLAVCGEATTRLGALTTIKQSNPDLAIVDLALEGNDDGLDLVKDIKACYPKMQILVLSMHSEATYAERALRAGAGGYVSKQQLDETVLVAIRRLLGGDVYMSEALAAQLAVQFIAAPNRPPGPLALLSDRQLQVFRLIGEGRTTRDIAQLLHLSIKTIESHREHLKQKLVLDSSTDLVRRAIQWVETGAVN
jgi:DNA-binding NarL/FixJ family response regulator